MKPTIETDTKLTDRLQGETVKLSLDLSQMAHFMKILTDLYEDGELAVIREYSTNASDSHVMAGVTLPIQVKLPTPLRQTFEVQDFGLGMSYDDIKNVYGTYGASTKRETNDANGCLGLGSKSALTYTNMFSVRSVKDGALVHVAIYRDDEGTASMKFVTEPIATNEENNTTIIVPTSDSNNFQAKALKFYSAWPKGSVEVVDHDIPFVQDVPGAFWLTKKILIVPSNDNTANNGKINVVMGNVTYPYIKDEFDRRYRRNYAVYYYAQMDGGRDGNAEVDFVPSREALNLNTKTQSVLTAALKDSDKDAIITYGQKQINRAKSLHDAVGMVLPFTKLHTSIRDGVFSYKGTVLQRTIKAPDTKIFDPSAIERRDMVLRMDEISIDVAHKSLFIVDKPENKPFLFKNKEQIRVHMKKIGLDLEDSLCYFIPVPDTKLLAGVKTAKWEDIRAIPVTVVYEPGTRKPPTIAEYRYTYQGETVHYPRVLPKAKKYVYVVNYSSRYSGSHRMIEWSKIHTDICFVYMTQRRVDKFVRENPGSIPFNEWQTQKINTLPDIKKHERDWLALDDSSKKILSWAIEQGVKDEYLVKLTSVDRDKVEKLSKRWYTYGKSATGENYVREKFPLANTHYEEHTKAYLKGLALV